jgi:hypothetical protein
MDARLLITQAAPFRTRDIPKADSRQRIHPPYLPKIFTFLEFLRLLSSN